MQVSKMTTVRDLLVMARHGLVPGKLAYVSRRTGTPIYMILLYGTVCGEPDSQIADAAPVLTAIDFASSTAPAYTK